MLSALLGLIGVLVGVFLTQLFIISSEWRNRRLDAMVTVAAAMGRILGAHERLYEIFRAGITPPLTDDRVVRALTERSEAHNDWRSASSRLRILIPDDLRLAEAMENFNKSRELGSKWVLAYLEAGEVFDFTSVQETDSTSWHGMRDARHEFMACSRDRSQLDARFSARLRFAFWARSVRLRNRAAKRRSIAPP
jgi:hypothetical protein